jgi:hypothetical protein
MNGGEITNNTAQGAGGGVYIADGGTFTKSGGIITGYADDTENGNTCKNSSNNIVNLRGHAVIYRSTTNIKVRDSTAGPLVNMDSSVSGTAGGWDYGI